MRTKLFLINFLLICSFIIAQSTGYMGKRVLLGYGLHASPAIFGSNANNESMIGDGGTAETGVFALNTIHEGFLEFSASSKWMICLSARYYKTTYDNHLNFRQNSGYSGNTSYISYGSSTPKGYYTIQGLTYTLYFKYYGSRYVAPWGRYVMFGPTLNTVKASYDPAIMKVDANYYDGANYGYYKTDTVITNFGSSEQKFKGLNLMLGFGRSRIIADRVTLDYGCNIQAFSVLSTLFDFEGTGLFSSKRETVDANNYIEKTNKVRVRGVNRFNVFLKVGILLF